MNNGKYEAFCITDFKPLPDFESKAKVFTKPLRTEHKRALENFLKQLGFALN